MTRRKKKKRKVKMKRKKMKRLRLFRKKEVKIFLLKVEGKINRMILKKGSRKKAN